MNPQYHQNLTKIDYSIKRLERGDLDDYSAAQICQLHCVQLSGTIEHLFREALLKFAERKSEPRVHKYISKSLSSFQNPRPEKILELLGNFEPRWAADLDEFWEGEIKDAVGSIVGDRHQIAHGRDVTVTLSRVRNWKKCVDRLAEYVWGVVAEG